MIAADHDGALELAAFDHLVERQAGDIALAQSKPADARRQALKRNTFTGYVQPALYMRVFREDLFDLAIGLVEVLRFAHNGKASCRVRVCQNVYIRVAYASLQKHHHK